MADCLRIIRWFSVGEIIVFFDNNHVSGNLLQTLGFVNIMPHSVLLISSLPMVVDGNC